MAQNDCDWDTCYEWRLFPKGQEHFGYSWWLICDIHGGNGRKPCPHRTGDHHDTEAATFSDLNKAQPKYPDSPSPDPTWRPDPDTIKVTAIEGADGRYGAVASADPDKAKRHAMALYVETHDSSLQKAECSCGWKTDWTSNDRRDRLIRRHLENRTLQKQED